MHLCSDSQSDSFPVATTSRRQLEGCLTDIVESEESELADELVLDDGTAFEESGDEFLLIHVLVKISHEHFAACQCDERKGISSEPPVVLD